MIFSLTFIFLLPRIAHLTVCESQSNVPKIKIQKLKFHELQTHLDLFSYIKREMRERQRENKRDRRNKN
jgi:hypothetical protein